MLKGTLVVHMPDAASPPAFRCVMACRKSRRCCINVDHEAEALLGPAPNRFQPLRLEQYSKAPHRLDPLCKSLARDKRMSN
jgi:hypothetical protein